MNIGDLVKWRDNEWSHRSPILGIVIKTTKRGWMTVHWFSHPLYTHTTEPLMHMEVISEAG